MIEAERQPKIDLKSWNLARLKVEDRIRRLKEARRETGQPRWNTLAFNDSQLRLAKVDATNLYIERAESRGKVHGPS